MWERRRDTFTYVIFLLTLVLAGCQGNGGSVETLTDPLGVASGETAYIEFVDEEVLEWKDNSLDDLQAVINLPINDLKADGEQYGGRTMFFVGETGAVRFKNHLLGSYNEDWSGVNGIDASGNEYSERITVDLEYVGMQVDLLGPVSGKAGYVASRDHYDEDYNVIGHWFYELNDKYEKTNEFYVKLPTKEDLATIMGDGKGNIHLTYMDVPPNDYKYVILSSEGKALFETTGNFREGLRAFGNGRVAACEIITDGNTMTGRLVEADEKNGTLTEIGVLSAANIYGETDKRETRSYFVTPVNEDKLAWCGSEGLYFCNARGEDTKMAYRWSNHGITMQGVAGMYAKEDGEVAIVYKDDGGMKYLLLKPTSEKREITSITFAVTSFHKEAFTSAVADFNKKYPTYNIEVRDDYDETSLLTQLGAGSGPVLIDTALTGFEELEKLWQPLSGFMEKTGLVDEVIPKALDFGKIGDETYGIVTNFTIRAMSVADSASTDWNYEGFLDSVEKFDGAVFTAEWFDAFADERLYFFGVLSNGLRDNAYFDLDKGSFTLGTKEFERIIKLSEKARTCPRKEAEGTQKSGVALCELINVSGAEGLIRLRARRESGERITGYPTKNGAKYLLFGQSPIAVRNTASDEEKKIAYTFLSILLSKESAIASIKGNTYAAYSVRKDVLDEQFDLYEDKMAVNGELGNNDRMPTLDREKDQAFFNELIQNAVIQRSFPLGLQQVFDEEFGDYVGGRIGDDALADHLKSRVRLYLSE